MRSIFKNVIRIAVIGLGLFLLWPLGLIANCEKRFTRSKIIYNLGAQTVALLPGFPGNYFRAAYYMMTLNYFHYTAIVSFGSYFSSSEARIQHDAKIGAYCIIGMADIMPLALIASRVSILSGTQEHGSSEEFMNDNLKDGAKRVVIGENAWVGEGAIVAADVGEHSIVGTGSVLLNPVPKRSVAMGNPARQIPIKTKSNTT